MAIRVTADVVVFTFQDSQLQVLLVRRRNPPHRGRPALPGGFVEERESLAHAALRELKEETGLRGVTVEQLHSFGDPGRDPRGRVVTVAHIALVPPGHTLRPGSDAAAVGWWPVDKLPRLAFDHSAIVECALEHLRDQLDYTTAGFQLLPAKFSLPELQTLYEIVLGRKLDKRNFRKKMDLLGILKPRNEFRRTGRKPARLYSFVRAKFTKFKDKGILFPF